MQRITILLISSASILTLSACGSSKSSVSNSTSKSNATTTISTQSSTSVTPTNAADVVRACIQEAKKAADIANAITSQTVSAEPFNNALKSANQKCHQYDAAIGLISISSADLDHVSACQSAFVIAYQEDTRSDPDVDLAVGRMAVVASDCAAGLSAIPPS